ncbi:endoribonuclease ysh1 [Dispira parvispora]|uniref:Endoribonuclease YSH1 n=1 Tax=Dispira parvispora TaxID=1520584 RepID=A0A9W8E2P4_9FUNG|nr:endoribonuclease ysh1 [Dispira parvispora]
MAYKRKGGLEVAVEDGSDILRITPLGAGNEVGRSCIVVEYKNKRIMLDAGVHPAYSGLGALPFFDEIDPASIDMLLVTHFHLDHAAAVPYFMEKTTFQGRTFMTHPTKAIYKWLLADYVRVTNVGADEQLYDEEDLKRSYERIEAIDYHQVVEVDGVRFSAYNAGHVLGAAMFLIEIAGIKILYTGDYSREEDRHLMAAEKPNARIDVLICESTFGVQSHEPRLEREARFTSITHQIIRRGGRCLIPVFALGWAQELLLILDEYWEAHPELDAVPIYYASSLARKCIAIYQTYIHMMNEHIRRQFATSNPFIFKHISYLRNIQQFEDLGPCVMVASPGMLQNGLSRELFEKWCSEKRNGILITGYSVEGTLARHILSEPSEIDSIRGGKLAVRLTIGSITFSAHVDFTQNSEFIHQVQAPHVVLVHGETNAMSRLRAALQDQFTTREVPTKVYTPRNCETVELRFKEEKVARVVGDLALRTADSLGIAQPGATPEDNLTTTDSPKKKPRAEEPSSTDKLVPLDGILVTKDYEYRIMDEQYLCEFTGLQPTEILQRQAIPYYGSLSLLRYHLEQMFGTVHQNTVGNHPVTCAEHFGTDVYFKQMTTQLPGDKMKQEAETAEKGSGSTTVLSVYEAVDVIHQPDEGLVELAWMGNYLNDMVADSIVAIVVNIECSPASVKLTRSECGHHGHGPTPASPEKSPSGHVFASGLALEQVATVQKFLEEQFGSVVQLDQPQWDNLLRTYQQHEEGQVAEEVEVQPREDQEKSDQPQETSPKVPQEGTLLTEVVGLKITLDDDYALLNLDDFSIKTTSKPLQERLHRVLRRVCQTLRPCK